MTKIASFAVVMVLTFNGTAVLASENERDADSAVVQAIPPSYPPLALAANVSGEVAVDAAVDWKGNVVSVRTIEGHKLLSAAAEKSASRWKFVSLTERANERLIRLYFKFTMVPRNGTPDDIVTIFWPPHRVEVKDTPGRLWK